MKRINSLAEAKVVQARVVQLDILMEKAQANPAAWTRTLGVPGARYMPEWESAMSRLTAWMGRATNEEVEALYDYEQTLRG